jgi:hypothetical protein
MHVLHRGLHKLPPASSNAGCWRSDLCGDAEAGCCGGQPRAQLWQRAQRLQTSLHCCALADSAAHTQRKVHSWTQDYCATYEQPRAPISAQIDMELA